MDVAELPPLPAPALTLADPTEKQRPPADMPAEPPSSPSSSRLAAPPAMPLCAPEPPPAMQMADSSVLTAEDLERTHRELRPVNAFGALRLLGEGASAQVWEGTWGDAHVVLKVQRPSSPQELFLKEVRRPEFVTHWQTDPDAL